MLFLHTIAMFQVAAMQQLGKILDPVSGEITRDLVQARISIDILEVLKDKTRGNLSKTEEEFLDKVLFELHMNYVDEARATKETTESEGEGANTENKKPGEGVGEGETGK